MIGVIRCQQNDGACRNGHMHAVAGACNQFIVILQVCKFAAGHIGRIIQISAQSLAGL